jgi:hypothetical protein
MNTLEERLHYLPRVSQRPFTEIPALPGPYREVRSWRPLSPYKVKDAIQSMAFSVTAWTGEAVFQRG